MTRKFYAATILVLSLFYNASLAAQKIRSIEYKGNIRIPNETIFAYLDARKGEQLDQDKLDKSIKSLFKTGFFSDVKLSLKGEILLVEVVENPMINKVAFDGNRKIDDEDLLPEIYLKPRSIFSYGKVQEDVNKIINIYQKRGRYAAKVEPKMIKLDQNRINLVYEIDEGPETSIQKIIFDGNSSYSSTDLAGVIASREHRWYRFFSSADVYDPDKFKFDAELLKRFYLNHGFADIKIVSKTAELSPSKDSFILTFVLDEGDIYSYGNVTIDNQIKNLNITALENLLKLKKGNQFIQDDIDENIEVLTDYLGNHGFPFIDVEAIVNKNKEFRTADISFRIKEEFKAYINKINIKNNTRTLDKVIRREFRIAEGDPYNVSKIQRSKQRIENLGFFNKVDFKNQKTNSPDKIDIDVDVEETSTGSINFMGGYNTSSGILGSIILTERNFLGNGQEVSLGFTASKKEKDYNFSFTEPHFLDKELSAGIDVFSNFQDLKSEASFSSHKKGFVLRLGYNITEHLSHLLSYGLKREKIYSVATDASRYIKEQAGKTTVSHIGQSFIYDRRDSSIDTKEGYKINLEQELAGLGGNVKYISHEVGAAYYIPFFKKTSTLLLRGSAGNKTGIWGKKTTLSTRYYIGSEQIRGFDYAGIGPRDLGSKDKEALGGKNFYATTVEFQFPLGLPEELGIKAGIFNDAGSLFGLDFKSPKIADKHSIRASYGTSLYWKSPLGPIGLHYGIPYKKEKYDDIKRFNLTFSTFF